MWSNCLRAGITRYAWAWVIGVTASLPLFVSPALAQRPPTDRHIAVVADYLDRVQLAEPIHSRGMSVFPVTLERDYRFPWEMHGLDAALASGVLLISEKGDGGSVGNLTAENRSGSQYVLMLQGEIVRGGKQTRTLRDDVVIGPGQRVELDVYCVEKNRWQGGAMLSAAGVLAPQSVQAELRQGADQTRIWAKVAENNQSLGAENATGSLETALNAPGVRRELDALRRGVVPRAPAEAYGFVFAARGRALGAEFFGTRELAREYLPKLIDSYAIDPIVIPMTKKGIALDGREQPNGAPHRERIVASDQQAAIDFVEDVFRAGSRSASTPGAGSGIRVGGD
ncbi:MAG: ARPP-1 family domain-containing protein, partial [Planctomycetota bacterium]